MEYYIYITHNCNLRCTYCSSGKIFSSSKAQILTKEMMDSIIEYISINNNGNDSVVFFGGEPLLEHKIIQKFIDNTGQLNLSYILYTNGTLLDAVPLKLLNSLNTIFLSLDGDKNSHEKHRGKNTYDRIIGNLKDIKPSLSNFLFGRITVEEETNLYDSVINIIDYVDAVHWQIVNKPHFNNKTEFIDNYKYNLSRLFDYWLSYFEHGKILNVVPFQAIISSILFNHQNDGLSFRCRAGSSLQVIDIDGKIYWCDEYIGDENGIIGDITGKKPILKYEDCKIIFDDCINCNISSICLGRCKKCLKEYSDDTIRIYCNLTKYLIEIILAKIIHIKDIIKIRDYKLKDIYNVPFCTEEIP